MKLQRYDAEKVESDVCLSSDVEQLEAQNAEMLDAAKAVVKFCDEYVGTNGLYGEIEQLRAAIAKAEGEGV